MSGPAASERPALVGCGLVGAGWAWLMLRAGLAVNAWDPDPAKLESLERRLDSLGREWRDGGGRLTQATSLRAAVAEATLVQESGPESLAAKLALFAAIEDAAAADCLIASSTSAFVWSELAAQARHPGRFLTAHPFNPVHLVPLVELFTPDAGALARAEGFYRSLGKAVVCLRREARGHIANRLSAALWREAVHIVAEGIAGVGDVDRALTEGPGLRWAVQGAHLTYHLGGGPGGLAAYLEHLGDSQIRRWADLGSPGLSAEVRSRLVAGMAELVRDTPVAELERRRDEALRRILAVRPAGGLVGAAGVHPGNGPTDGR